MNSVLLKYLLTYNYLPYSINPSKTDKIDLESIAKALASFGSLGYKLDNDSIELLKEFNLEDFNNFYTSTFEVMNQLKSTNVKHIVMYKNFPNMEHYKEIDYVINAYLHYLTKSPTSYGILPIDEALKRDKEEHVVLEEVKLITFDEAKKFLLTRAKQMLAAPKAISYSDEETLGLIFDEFPQEIEFDTIPFKCNIATYLKITCSKDKTKVYDCIISLRKTLNTVIDVLRVYAVLSGANQNLKEKINFKSLPKKVRRLLLQILDEICLNNPDAISDLSKYEFYFKKAFEKLHVGEYAKLYPHIYDACYKLRSGEYYTYNSKLIDALNTLDEKTFINLVQIKPGMFSRNIDYYLRCNKIDQRVILDAFKKSASKVSSKVLIELLEYYYNRNAYSDNRVIFYRGSSTYVVKEMPESRAKLSDDVINDVINIITNALVERYSTKDKIENLYLDENFKNIMLPTNATNVSSNFRTLPFASKIKLDIKDEMVVRFFTHWKNIDNSAIDIDIAVEFYDENFDYIASLAWHKMDGGSEIKAYHSGDLTTAPLGASEFIDINISEAKAKGYRYAVVSNCVYTGESFFEIPECFSGCMLRSALGKKGEIFDVKTVKMKFDLTQKNVNCVYALCLDTYTNEIIWLDIPSYQFSNVVSEGRKYDIAYILQKAYKKKVSLYDLVLLHKGHVTFTSNKEEAKNFIDIYNQELIMKDWVE